MYTIIIWKMLEVPHLLDLMWGREISSYRDTRHWEQALHAGCLLYMASCNLRTDNIWFWDALHQVSHVFHPFLAFFCCLCGKQLSTTCADDLKLIRSLSLPFCFDLLNTQNAPELKEKLGLKASCKFSLCVIEGNSFGASSTFTNQYSPECCMTLTRKKISIESS